MHLLDENKRLSLCAFLLVSVMVYGICLLYFLNIVWWKDAPDWGFGFRNATGVHVVGTLGRVGAKAGLNNGDQILNVNGKPYDSYRTLNEARNWQIDADNAYLIRRGDDELVIKVKNEPLGFQRTFSLSGFPFLAGLCYIFIGTLVFLMKPHERGSWIFICFTSIFGLFITLLFKSNVLQPFWMENIIIFVWSFMGATFVHLALSFPEERKLLKRTPLIQVFPYVISLIVFIGIRIKAAAMLNAPAFWLNIIMVYLAVGVLIFIGSCFQLWIRSRSEMAKRRAKMILLGFGVAASVPLLDFIFNVAFNIYLVPGLNYYLPFFIVLPAFIAYSIVMHDLFAFDTIIKRTYGYVLTTASLAGLYGLFVLISNVAFGRFEITQSRLFPLVFMLAVVFFFNPIRNRVQKIIDKLFYRLEYDYQETVQKISETMRSLLKLDQIGKSIMDTALDTMFIDNGCVMLMHRQTTGYECLTLAGECGMPAEDEDNVKGANGQNREIGEERKTLAVSEEDPLIKRIAQEQKRVTIYDVLENPVFADDKTSYQQTFDQLKAVLILPLIYEDQLIGIIALGNKKSGKFYRQEDIALLTILANQGAVAIENAIMIEEVIEKERMEEELNIAKDLQVSMLPSDNPEIEGLEIASYSASAREVGGDFYDFIDMGEDKVGMLIGDVTGKSVSGALVMSASRSIFRMLSEEDRTVADIMTRANQRTKKDIITGMFVALLYAVVNAKERTIDLCSAGQTQPIHLAADSGDVHLVETEGDTFPLGILEEVEYLDTRMTLKPGDMVVFYTDGIVEAMNAQKELFGFDRLEEVIQGSTKMSAQSLLDKILEKVNTFAAGADQHDDITVIILKAKP